MQPSKQIRFIVYVSPFLFEFDAQLTVVLSNDAVVPIDESYPGCPANPNGLCSFDNVVEVLQKRSAEIDFDYDCFANYTAAPGQDYNGRAPRS